MQKMLLNLSETLLVFWGLEHTLNYWNSISLWSSWINDLFACHSVSSSVAGPYYPETNVHCHVRKKITSRFPFDPFQSRRHQNYLLFHRTKPVRTYENSSKKKSSLKLIVWVQTCRIHKVLRVKDFLDCSADILFVLKPNYFRAWF